MAPLLHRAAIINYASLSRTVLITYTTWSKAGLLWRQWRRDLLDIWLTSGQSVANSTVEFCPFLSRFALDLTVLSPRAGDRRAEWRHQVTWQQVRRPAFVFKHAFSFSRKRFLSITGKQRYRIEAVLARFGSRNKMQPENYRLMSLWVKETKPL